MGVSGGILVASGIVLLVFAILTFVRIVPAGVLHQDGGPGRNALAHTAAPGQMTAELQEGQTYVLYLARPTVYQRPSFEERPVVTRPSGESYEAGPPAVNSISDVPGTEAATEASFVARESGLHTVDVPQPEPERTEATAILVLGEPTGNFLSGALGGVAGIVAAILACALGLRLLLGAVGWSLTRRR